jgi:hypothetical protein
MSSKEITFEGSYTVFTSVYKMDKTVKDVKKKRSLPIFWYYFKINWGAEEPVKSLVFSMSIARITPRSSGYEFVF